MSTKVLHFIEKDKNQRNVEKTISELINKEPSNYVSHDVSSFTESSHTWNVTRLQLKNVTNIEATEQKDSDIEKVRQKEGILVFGSGPNLNDGTGRVIFTAVKRNQLKLSHLEALMNGYFQSESNRFNSTYSDRCFSVGGELFHYAPGFETDSAFQCHRSHAHWLGTHSIDRDENGSAVRGTLKVSKFGLYGSTERNLILPERNLNNDFEIELHQLKPSWCGCMLDVMVSRVKITAVETTECIIPLDEGYGYEGDIREATLQDKEFQTEIKRSDMKGDHDDRYFKLPFAHYDCSLPNLGATFFSKNCSRTYALRFSVTFMCLEKKCTSTFNVTLNIVVGLKEFEKLKAVENGLFKKRDYLYIQNFPKTEAVAQDIDEWVRKKALAIGKLTLNSHICAIPGEEVIFGIITVSQFCHDIQNDHSSSLIIEEDEDNAVDPAVDYTDAIVYSNHSFRFRSKNLEMKLKRSHCYSPGVVQYMGRYQPDGTKFGLGWKANSMVLDEPLWTSDSWLCLDDQKKRTVYVKKINISFVERTQRNEGESRSQKVKTQTLVDKKYGRFQGVPLHIKKGSAELPKELLDGVWPQFNPTVATNLFSRENALEIRLEIKTSFATTEYVGLRIEYFIYGNYDALVESSSLPPYHEEDEKQLTEKEGSK